MKINVPSRPQDHFTMVPNHVARDKRLSWKARGLFLYLSSNVSGWSTSLEKLAAISQDGITSTRSGINELIKYGYLVRTDQQVHRDSGAFGGYVYDLIFHPAVSDETGESPSSGNLTKVGEPSSGFPTMGNPTLGNRTPKKTISKEDHHKREDQGGWSTCEGTSLVRPQTVDKPPHPQLIRCDAHAGMVDTPPCRGCAHAKLSYKEDYEAWRQARRDENTRKRLEHLELVNGLVSEAIEECDLCDENGYAGLEVCSHDPELADRRARGLDQVYRVLGVPRPSSLENDI